jgi:type I restriction enzyme M protein
MTGMIIAIAQQKGGVCGMNLYLHGIGNGESPIRSADALANDPGERFDVISTNPPFGRKSSYRVIGDDGVVDTEREDYDIETPMLPF